MKATVNGKLRRLKDCYIKAGTRTLEMKILPDISDQKQANYSDESGIGRSAPLKVFSHGDTRSISWSVHFFGESDEESKQNLFDLRFLESLVYPDSGTSTLMVPPPLVTIKCGSLLGDNPLCAVLKSYNVKFPVDVMWDETTFLPIKFDVELSFGVVYATFNLPGTKRILQTGG